ncbi:MAG: metallophosphoesterase [Oscillospiraceae bacterium]|nr:metallophosphoesterase [Oscillospiraceae bacterium]
MEKRRARPRARRYIVCAAALLLTLFLIWSNLSLQTEEFIFSSERLPASFDGFRIVQLSDLHGAQFGRDNARLVAAVEEANPDIVVLTGDMIDERSSLDDLLPLVDALTARWGVYYVTGNHEWAAHDVPELIKEMESRGAACLENEYTSVYRGGERILLAGIHDPNGYADQKTPDALAQELAAQEEDDPFRILLAHRNDEYPAYGALGFDLILSGHAHGGRVRLPVTDGRVSTGHTLFPTWTDGFYDDCPTPLFVSRGLGNTFPTLRLFNRPQIAVITLEKTE